MEIEIPTWGISVVNSGAKDEMGRDIHILYLDIATSGTHHQFFLCLASDNYQDIAKQIHDKICEAGRKARRVQSGLVAVNGVNSDALRSKEQGR